MRSGKVIVVAPTTVCFATVLAHTRYTTIKEQLDRWIRFYKSMIDVGRQENT